MSQMNKEFEYKGHKFNIKVELNTTVERKPNGLVLHTVTINDMGFGNFYMERDVEDTNMVEEITKLEFLAKQSVDKTERDKAPNQTLYDLGFR